jgi:hypothetical protein
MTWIRVTAIPNGDALDHPRMTFLIDAATVAGFGQRPGELVQVFFDWELRRGPTLVVAESLEDIEAQIRAGEAATQPRRRRTTPAQPRSPAPGELDRSGSERMLAWQADPNGGVEPRAET